MTGFGERYMVDTNALIRLQGRRRASPHFLEHSVFPSEVLREAGGLPDIGALRRNVYPTTPQVLEWLVRVMATVPTSDRKLVDLYANHGAADPFVVACALDGRQRDNVYLDAPEWIVVTNDDAVQDKARQFGLQTLSSEELSAILDAEQGEPASL
ncbi:MULTISPECIES: hypothetical protein [Microbacterium]|uniref:PIN domain-containing protein n=1 Tax=Microbacterium wangchenii TaxID=2541726 RepID=A0ABX5SSK6_9MICO|nr:MULTISPECIES: hypothetical protein [Microbacterium]MCK6065720.1 hypothetical protein [Microbacterium sp. EYE_512]QBR89126.1 hypothetical protein E4K62_10785 [Microbacterium wangchenii]TXK20846.1 NYN domain-containing protein [Microbacterium wangchenii]